MSRRCRHRLCPNWLICKSEKHCVIFNKKLTTNTRNIFKSEKNFSKIINGISNFNTRIYPFDAKTSNYPKSHNRPKIFSASKKCDFYEWLQYSIFLYNTIYFAYFNILYFKINLYLDFIYDQSINKNIESRVSRC